MSQTPVPSGSVSHPELLAVYVNDHIAAAAGGIELVSRMIGVHRGTEREQPLRQLLDELREEKAAIISIAQALDFPVRQYKQVASWIAEKASRAKLNGHLLSRSPSSDLVEFEFLASAVRGKRSGLETLRIAATVDSRIDADLLDRLIQQANRQHDWATEVRRDVAARVFGGDPSAPDLAADNGNGDGGGGDNDGTTGGQG
ncbi:hypothetical protein O2W15_21725 [Modestobacter sp. VKM Ac-2979]|uniref:hypothetical protein n=1 Tax=unclassified Modestobacter TaxID=2643866 RepID=UPI0022ABB45C|nr:MULTISPECIES: hypothetical protein [unclassified Modestobacter]MCZ2814057.1 hypothetical protein [Modestobacter sp. VKM Ac-2979]MCZ2844527.1 hypothetical protein [Modestobacter sp. VKM Ac-2980]